MTSAAPLFERTVAALTAVGLSPSVDAELEHVSFAGDGGPDTVGVVMTHFNAVVFYAVWPDQVPDEALAHMAELVVRANTELYTSALELDVDKQILSARAALDCAGLGALDAPTVGALLAAALDEARRVYRTHDPAVAAVAAGGTALDGLSRRSA